MPASFFDTNVLLYAASHDTAKADRVEELLAEGGTISVQVLNEIANVARRKLKLPWGETRLLLEAFRELLSVRPLTVETHAAALQLAERYGFSFYDALIVAAAMAVECDRLWSEDMQDGLVIEQRLRIANPFVTR